MTVLRFPTPIRKVNVLGMFYAVSENEGEPIFLAKPGNEPVLPLCSDEEKLAAFVARYPIGGYRARKVERSDFLDTIRKMAMAMRVTVTVMLDPEQLTSGSFMGVSTRVGIDEEETEVRESARPFSTPYRADRLWDSTYARFMPCQGGIPTAFQNDGIEYYPVFESEVSARKVLKRLRAPFEEIREVRDPSVIVRAVESIKKGVACRLALGESIKGSMKVLKCSWTPGANEPSAIGASAPVDRLAGKIIPMVVGKGFYALRLLGSPHYYVPMFERREDAMALLGRDDGHGPDGDFTIVDEESFLQSFPERLSHDPGKVQLISGLKITEEEARFDAITWRN
jgi:hypothetical protein